MDKTLLRPLFQKRFMELHKPVKAFAGLFANKDNNTQEPAPQNTQNNLDQQKIQSAIQEGRDKANEGVMALEPTPNEIEVAKQEDKRVIRETQEAGKQAQQNPDGVFISRPVFTTGSWLCLGVIMVVVYTTTSGPYNWSYQRPQHKHRRPRHKRQQLQRKHLQPQRKC